MLLKLLKMLLIFIVAFGGMAAVSGLGWSKMWTAAAATAVMMVVSAIMALTIDGRGTYVEKRDGVFTATDRDVHTTNP